MSIPSAGYPLTVDDCESIPLGNPNGWSLRGFSKAGERTSFRVEPLNVLLDAGLMSIRMPRAICMTHSHVDHSWNLPNITGGMKVANGDSPIPVYFPKQAYVGLTKLLDAACYLSYPLQTFTEKDVWEQHKLVPKPVAPGDTFYIGSTQVEVLPAVHTVNSVGYGFSNAKSKLKQEYKDLAGNNAKIVELRKQGIEVSERIPQEEFAFFCDSTIQNLTKYEEWKKYPSIVVECTGYPEIYDRQLVQNRGHTHYDDLIEVIKQNSTKNWFLIHSSMKCDKKFLEKAQQELFKDLKVKILSVF